ncbi:MAG: lipid-A-disaccharide synthase, partial [Acidobacteriota bacterium]|nr:lipid-A-disaccharide synthase [Acidobacteriota bacterium]
LLVVAGEASGDQHGAELIRELRQLLPDLSYYGIGGTHLEAQGVDLLGRSSEVAVVGITEALKVLPRARQFFRSVLAEAEQRETKVAVLIDFPEFNLRLARRLARRGISVVYYISPQLWAWRQRRVKTIARVVEDMLVLFPFEADFYHQHGVDATHVGHPLVEQVPEPRTVWDGEPPESGEFTVALLPGSRASELEKLLPILCSAAARLAAKVPTRFLLAQAPTVLDEAITRVLSEVSVPIEVVRADRFEAIDSAHLALCASGTATLEVGLLQTPMIVVYQLSRWTSLVARMLVELPHYSLVNLVLGAPVVPELLQENSRPETIASEAESILQDPPRVREMVARLGELRRILGEPGASLRAAQAVARRIAMVEK